ncbi:MAG: phosphotransferase [Pseudomonadota bacterium]
MKDAGVPLRGLLKASFNREQYIDTIRSYARIQISCVKHLDDLVAIGLDDWRLQNLPSLYRNFITQDELLQDDGMSDVEIHSLQSHANKLYSILEELSSCGIPETIEHGDFHDNNILIKDGIHTISDWGDVSISHPFFSCAGMLGSAKRHYPEVNIEPLQEEYLSAWKKYGSKKVLTQALDLAQKLRPFLFALNFSRIKSDKDCDQFPEYKGYIADSLRDLLRNLA